jgi:hypothetical protein
MKRFPWCEAHRTIIACRCFLLALFLVFFASNGLAKIRFQEVSVPSGITGKGATFGASWGDFDGNGWPDLWVSNHNRTPALYLNKQDGTFENIIDQVWSAKPNADTHGAAWADFNNNGRQDLIQLVDAKENEDGTFCVGCGKNQLFINQNGRIVEQAADFGLDQLGLGRSPLWLDADGDGLLDLLAVNVRQTDKPVSTVFLQKNNKFTASNELLGFKDSPWERSSSFLGRVQDRIDDYFGKPPQLLTHWGLESAQLADLSSNGKADLILFSLPTRVYAIDQVPFKDISKDVGLPDLSRVKDVAVADFNGDGKMDLFALAGSWLTSHVIRESPSEIYGMITWSGKQAPKAVTFQADGEVHFQIYPTWLHLSKVFIGSSGRHPVEREFVLSPEDAGAYGVVDSTAPDFEGVTIGYDPDGKTWTIRNVQRSIYVDFIARASGTIVDFQTIGFDLFKVDGKGVLYSHQKNGLSQTAVFEDISCISAATGDFDNDMDLDLYLICTGPIMNLPNMLLQNDGKGNFTAVLDAGGAAGTHRGRGDVAAVADYNQDGFLDLFVANGADPNSPFVDDAPHQLFLNRGNGQHWLQIDLEGVRSNRDAIGARVAVEAGGVVQERFQTGGIHRIAQDYKRLHFGLGGNDQVDRISVFWPSGTVQHLNGIAADQILHIIESPVEKQ